MKELFQVVSPHPLSKRVPVREAVFLVFNVDIPPALHPFPRGRNARAPGGNGRGGESAEWRDVLESGV